MMPDRLENYRAYVRFVRRLVLFAGLWPGSKEPGILYRHLVIFVILSGLVMLCALGLSCWKNVTNVSVLTKSLSLFASFTAVSLKALLFKVYRKELRELNRTLDLHFEEALSEPRCRSVLLSLLRFFQRPAYVYAFATGVTIFLYVIKPLILIVQQFSNGSNLRLIALPYPTVYPWSIKNSTLLYQLHFAFETQFSWFVVLITSGVDTLFGLYMFQMSALLRAMSFEFSDLPVNTSWERVLRDCVAKHNSLIKCRDVVQTVYGPIVLFMALTNAVIMCSLVFQAVQLVEMSIDKVMLFSAYIFMKMAQTFMYAWYGSVVATESENFQREVYLSRWYDEGMYALGRKNVLFILMQRPLTLTACSFFNISMDFFVGILHTAISYFFLLQTLEDN